MASASKTPNLNLPQWAANEKPERTDFNTAFDAIDSSIKPLQDAGTSPKVAAISMSLKTLAEDTQPNTYRFFTTADSTTDLPANTTTWKYSSGFMFNRGGALKIVLYAFNTADVAYMHYASGTWSDWTIK